MTPTMRFVVVTSLAMTAGAAVIIAQGPSRPGEMTQARVWVENRSPNEAIPVVVERIASVDQSVTVATRVVRQGWEYRSIVLAAGAESARDLERAGNEGWEAVGTLQTGPAGTVLFKRPR
jgi:hypothetical protein